MNRDAVLATIIGFAIGLFITGIFLLGPNIKGYLPGIKLPTVAKSPDQKSPAASTSPVPNPQVVSIDSPLSDAVLSSDSLLVSGTAPAQSTVLIQGENDDVVVIIGNDGKYSGKLTLNEGKNDIAVTGYDQTGTPTSAAVTVFYSAEPI